MPSTTGPEHHAFESRGARCEADLYARRAGPTVADGRPGPRLPGPRPWGLDRFATRFARDGIAAFVFDYCGFGTSGGTPRRLVDPGRQLEDWQGALDHVRSMDGVDAVRLVAWGRRSAAGTRSRRPDANPVPSIHLMADRVLDSGLDRVGQRPWSPPVGMVVMAPH